MLYAILNTKFREILKLTLSSEPKLNSFVECKWQAMALQCLAETFSDHFKHIVAPRCIVSRRSSRTQCNSELHQGFSYIDSMNREKEKSMLIRTYQDTLKLILHPQY